MDWLELWVLLAVYGLGVATRHFWSVRAVVDAVGALQSPPVAPGRVRCDLYGFDGRLKSRMTVLPERRKDRYVRRHGAQSAEVYAFTAEQPDGSFMYREVLNGESSPQN